MARLAMDVGSLYRDRVFLFFLDKFLTLRKNSQKNINLNDSKLWVDNESFIQ